MPGIGSEKSSKKDCRNNERNAIAMVSGGMLVVFLISKISRYVCLCLSVRE